jgi:hypothetical protein
MSITSLLKKLGPKVVIVTALPNLHFSSELYGKEGRNEGRKERKEGWERETPLLHLNLHINSHVPPQTTYQNWILYFLLAYSCEMLGCCLLSCDTV